MLFRSSLPGIGPLRDYYAWTWGDALFVTIDPYWHSPVPVDNGVTGVNKVTDLWQVTMGDVQYQWLKQVLESSRARYKFVFEHHVLGTGRGFAMPAGVPKEAAAAMEAVLRRVHDSAAWKDFVARNAYEDVYMNGAEFGAQLARSRVEMAQFLLAIGVTQIRK